MEEKVATVATLYLNGDWEGLYLNGKLFAEGHSIRMVHMEELTDVLLSEKYDRVNWSGGFAEIEDDDLDCCPASWDEVEALEAREEP